MRTKKDPRIFRGGRGGPPQAANPSLPLQLDMICSSRPRRLTTISLQPKANRGFLDMPADLPICPSRCTLLSSTPSRSPGKNETWVRICLRLLFTLRRGNPKSASHLVVWSPIVWILARCPIYPPEMNKSPKQSKPRVKLQKTWPGNLRLKQSKPRCLDDNVVTMASGRKVTTKPSLNVDPGVINQPVYYHGGASAWGTCGDSDDFWSGPHPHINNNWGCIHLGST